MFLILLIIFAAVSPNFAPTVPTLISTYTLEKGEEKVFVRHVKVEQINTQDLGQIVRECNGPGVEGFFSGGMNEFKLDWKKCEIMDGVDTLKMSIFYTKSGDEEGRSREFEFKVELHNQQRIKTDYTFNMNMHGEGGRKNEGMEGENAKESETVEGVKNEEKRNGKEMNGEEGRRKEKEEEAKKANGPIENGGNGEIGQKEGNLVVGNEGMNEGGGTENGGKEKQKEGTKQGEGEMKKGAENRAKLLPLKWDELMKEGSRQQLKEAGKTNNIRTSSSI